AEDKPDEPKKVKKGGPIAADEDDDKPGATPEKEFPPFEKVTKDFAASEGYWDLWFRQKDQGLLAVVPTAELEKPFLFTVSLSGGAPQAGWQLASTLVAWERLGKKLVLVEKNVAYRADAEKPIADAVVRTYSDRVLLATQILSESPKGLAIDLKDVLVNHARDFLGVSIDGSLSKVTKRKAFPQNCEVAFSAPLSGDGTLLLWHYSIARLPEPEASGFHARVADDRIGYFLTAVKDYTKGDPSENRFVRLVNKWNLQKAQPELALSPPKKPIVFYIEKTVPFRYRRWVEAGIVEWNKAFEKCGFSGAIVARQQTADNEFKDFDPEDARYNFFRWVVNDEGYAMGPSRVDPRTGQILDADIIFDDSMVEFYAGEYETLLKDGPQVYKGKSAALSPDAQMLAGKLSQALEPFGVKIDADRACSALAGVPLVSGPARTKAELHAKLNALVPASSCRIGEGVRHQLALGAMKFAVEDANQDGTRTRGIPEEFWGEVVKETVMHEVGHTLGLRHNFKGSSFRTLEDINSEERPGDVSGSVMDYNALNIAPEGRPQGHFQNTLLGPYDIWAIEYGYMVPKDARPDLEPAELSAIAQRSNERGHAYGTDEDLPGADPICITWDMGTDPLAYAKSRLEFAKKLRSKLLAKAVKQGESWEKLRRAFEMVLFEQARAGYYAARLVGAAEVRRNHKGDPGEKPPLELVSVERQRAALQFACEQVFDDKAFQLTPELLTHLAAGRWDHWGSEGGTSPSYPVHERILMAQRYTLNTLLSEGVLARLRDGQVKTPQSDEALTASELFSTLEKAIFRELEGQVNGAGPRSPAISTFRQNLQDYYVRRLADYSVGQQAPGVLPANAAAKKLAALHVKALGEKAQAFLTSSKLDEDSRAHVDALAKRAEQVRAAEYVHIASGAGCALSPVESVPAALAPLAVALLALVVLRRRSAA
ncbi:MAG: zinc-dependent metalloprotease, partial [Planctomycetota bacterium]